MSELPSTADPRCAVPVIATARLVLREPQTRDVAAIVARIGNWEVARMLSRVPYPYRIADAEEFIATAGEQNAAGDHLHLIIEHEGEPVGGIGLHGTALPHDFGYWLAQPWWGRGLATEAAAALLSFAFREYGAESIPSGVFADNPASLRVQEKLGFVRTGTSRLFNAARGTDVDHIDTVLTREAFEEGRG